MADAYIRVNIRRLLDERGIKNCKVAKELGMSKSTFCDMMYGRKIIRVEYLPIIIKAIGCTYDDLFRKPEEES